MTAEPLWRGKTTQQGAWNTYSFLTEEDGDLPALDCPPGTEVEVWPAGDRTCPYVETGDEGTSYCRLAEAGDRPTREQIHAVVSENLLDQRWANKCTDELMALLHGQGDETDEDAT